MKKARIFVAAFATVLAASFAVAGGDNCGANKDVASGEKAGCCKGGAQVAKGGADDAGKAGECADMSAGDCASMGAKAGCKGGAEVAKGGAEDAGKAGECADKGACAGKCGEELAKGGAEDAGKGLAEGFGIGQKPSAIELPDAVTGTNAPLVDGTSDATVVIFWNQECPYVVEAQDRISAFAKEAKDKNVRVVAVDANDPELANSAAKIKEYASTRPFPILVNNDSTVALKFGATRTPEAFVFDKAGVIQYHGAFDGGQKDPKKTYVADAVTAVLAGNAPEVTSTRAFGCTIKYGDAAKTAMKSKISEKKAGIVAESEATALTTRKGLGERRKEVKALKAAEDAAATAEKGTK